MKRLVANRLKHSWWLFVIALTAGCREDSHQGHTHAPSTASSHAHGHEHIAPHGGEIVVLGNEAFHLELVHDRAAGRLTLYVLDGHMENFIRLPVPSLKLTCTIDGKEQRLTLAAVAQAATGETVGNTSQFAGEAEWLKTNDRFTGVLEALAIQGMVFAGQSFAIPGAPASR